MITRRILLSAAFQRKRRPNIIWFMPDQWRGQALGSLGDPNAITPHLDRLAKEGVQFTNTIANTPVCCPARAILQTGQYVHRNGMVANDLRLRENHTTIAKVLGAAGYRTAFIGKWHLDGGPRQPGFIPPGPRRQGFQYWAANSCSHNHFNATYFRDDATVRPLGKFEAEGWTDLALEFLDSHKNNDQPYFLMVAPGPPHDPYGAPPEYEKRFDPAKLQLRKNYRGGGPRVPDRAAIAKYYAACTAIDDQIARLRQTLARRSDGEDTATFFFSDHGDMLGSHGLRLKRKPHEESIRVPGIVHYPRGIRQAHVEKGLFSHLDIPATTLGLCGVPLPGTFQGRDFSANITGTKQGTQAEVLCQIFGPYQGDGTDAGWRGLRTDRYMYARYENKPYVLFDLEKDPDQLENLAGKNTPLEREMDRRLAARMQAVGDSWKYNWTALVEDAGRLYKSKTYYTVEEYLRENSADVQR
ncbi:MAG: sulfatase [Bryobacter sp.]|nr:sulfatase [Bryobacter sp.]